MSIAFEDQQLNDEAYFSGDDLGFDFSDDLFSIVSTSSASAKGETDDQIVVVKAATSKRGSKFMRKKPALPSKPVLIPKVTSLGVRTALPNMSRCTRDPMLYVFPSFDRCDSLLFFPSTMARLMNSGDIPAVVKLLVSHCDKHCTLFGNKAPMQGMDMFSFEKKMEVLDQMQPDRITCIRQTKVSGNTIKAIGYLKFTKCRAIYEAAARTFRDTPEFMCFKQPWKDHMMHQLEQMTNNLPEENAQYVELIENNCDLIVYSRMDMDIVMDDRTKKVKQFDIKFTLTSMGEAKRNELE